MYISHKWSNVILINKFIVNVTFFSLHLCGSFCMKNKWYTFYSSVCMFFSSSDFNLIDIKERLCGIGCEVYWKWQPENALYMCHGG